MEPVSDVDGVSEGTNPSEGDALGLDVPDGVAAALPV